MKPLKEYEVVENVAFAIFKENRRLRGQTADLKNWARLCKEGQEDYRQRAKAAISAYKACIGG